MGAAFDRTGGYQVLVAAAGRSHVSSTRSRAEERRTQHAVAVTMKSGDRAFYDSQAGPIGTR